MTVSDLLKVLGKEADNINTIMLLTACSKLVDNFEQAVRTQLLHGLLIKSLQVVRFLRV